jgi:hypothetical protein
VLHACVSRVSCTGARRRNAGVAPCRAAERKKARTNAAAGPWLFSTLFNVAAIGGKSPRTSTFFPSVARGGGWCQGGWGSRWPSWVAATGRGDGSGRREDESGRNPNSTTMPPLRNDGIGCLPQEPSRCKREFSNRTLPAQGFHATPLNAIVLRGPDECGPRVRLAPASDPRASLLSGARPPPPGVPAQRRPPTTPGRPRPAAPASDPWARHPRPPAPTAATGHPGGPHVGREPKASSLRGAGPRTRDPSRPGRSGRPTRPPPPPRLGPTASAGTRDPRPIRGSGRTRRACSGRGASAGRRGRSGCRPGTRRRRAPPTGGASWSAGRSSRRRR